ncbi:MAG: c-type cytochrome [Acidimicrobiales bacterium]|nr:c-type cytochrome [Acidimicrobiales bacterium]
MTARVLVRLCAAALVLAALAGCAGSSPDVPLGPDGEPDPQLLLGRDVFSSKCATCHGSSGGGGRGPKLAEGEVVRAYPDIADQVAVVRAGKGNGMPAFEGDLTDEQIDAVVAYTREVL